MSKRGLAGISIRQAGMAHDLVPVAVGATASVGTALGIRAALDPSDPKSTATFVWAPAIGAGVSLLAAGIVYAIGGTGPAVATGIAGVLSSLGILASDMIVGKKAGAAAALATQYPPAGTNPQLHGVLMGLGNLAAVVPEYSQHMAGILFQKMDGVDGRNLQNAGQHVTLRGVSPAAFGKRSFVS